MDNHDEVFRSGVEITETGSDIGGLRSKRSLMDFNSR